MIWSVVLANGTPYLLSLGLPEPLTALAWMAGPLCGIFVQPYMGITSDNYSSRYGQRRPFIILGTIGTLLSMLLLAAIQRLVSSLDIVFILDEKEKSSITVAAALVLVWALNFWIQPLQMGMRALIVESFPQEEQGRASAWASYWVGCGNIIGYGTGFFSLPQALGIATWGQFQCLCLIAACVLTFTVAIGCVAGREERTHNSPVVPRSKTSGFPDLCTKVRTAYSNMTRRMRQVCIIQFFSWMAWFPFLYYGSTYVSELCKGTLCLILLCAHILTQRSRTPKSCNATCCSRRRHSPNSKPHRHPKLPSLRMRIAPHQYLDPRLHNSRLIGSRSPQKAHQELPT